MWCRGCGGRLGERLGGLVIRQTRRGKRDPFRLEQEVVPLVVTCPTCGEVWSLPERLLARVREVLAAIVAEAAAP